MKKKENCRQVVFVDETPTLLTERINTTKREAPTLVEVAGWREKRETPTLLTVRI